MRGVGLGTNFTLRSSRESVARGLVSCTAGFFGMSRNALRDIPINGRGGLLADSIAKIGTFGIIFNY